jgi:hypothetical protein
LTLTPSGSELGAAKAAALGIPGRG